MHTSSQCITIQSCNINQPSIYLLKNLPCRASNVLEHATRSNGDATFQNPTPTHGTYQSTYISKSNTKDIGDFHFHNPSRKKLVDLASHIPSPRAKGCMNNVYGGNGDPATQSHLKHKNMRKNANWDNTSLKLAMENVEMGDNL